MRISRKSWLALTAFLIILLLLVSSNASGAFNLSPSAATSLLQNNKSDGGQSQQKNYTKMLDRVVISGLYQDTQYRPGNESVQVVAKAIAKLKPSYVTSLIHLTGPYPENLTPAMIANYTYVRNVVLANSPETKFDVFLAFKSVNTSYYSTKQVLDEMDYVNSEIKFNIFNFDYAGQAIAAGHIATVESAIARAHSLGKLVTGHFINTSQLSRLSNERQQMNFIWTDTNTSLGLRTTFIEQEHADFPDLPLMVQINQNPQTNGTNPYLDGFAVCCYFIQVMNTSQRIAYVTMLAQDQTEYGYYYQYNLFFPACPAGVSFNPLSDGNYYKTLQNLMNNYSR